MGARFLRKLPTNFKGLIMIKKAKFAQFLLVLSTRLTSSSPRRVKVR